MLKALKVTSLSKTDGSRRRHVKNLALALLLVVHLTLQMLSHNRRHMGGGSAIVICGWERGTGPAAI